MLKLKLAFTLKSVCVKGQLEEEEPLGELMSYVCAAQTRSGGTSLSPVSVYTSRQLTPHLPDD